jgi:hypothetical protein
MAYSAYFSFNKCPIYTTEHLPNFALFETKRMTVYVKDNAVYLAKSDPPSPEDDDDVHHGMSACLPRLAQP